MDRRTSLRLAAGAVPALMTSRAIGQAYPSRPITIVVPWPPGAGTDAATRIIADALAKELGQSIVVENRPGANGAIGSTYVATGPKDGYRLITATSDTHSINPQVRTGLAYDAIRDFEPLALFATLSIVWVSRPDLPYKSMAEVVAGARGRTTNLTYGSWGIGSSAHLAGALLETATGMSLTHVPFQGAAPASAALNGGHIDLMPSSRLSAAAMRAAGKLKVLGVASTRRATGDLADVPTLEEQGFRGAEAGSWYGLMAPKGIPDDARQKLVTSIAKVLAQPPIQERIAATGIDPAPLTGPEFQEFLRVQYETFGKVIRSKQISLTE